MCRVGMQAFVSFSRVRAYDVRRTRTPYVWVFMRVCYAYTCACVYERSPAYVVRACGCLWVYMRVCLRTCACLRASLGKHRLSSVHGPQLACNVLCVI